MSETQNYEPKLKEALAKMEAIAKEYELGFVIALASATHSEFKTEFPEWSLIQRTEQGIRLRLRSSEPKLTEDSVSVLLGLRDMSGMMCENLSMVVDEAKKHIQIQHNRITDDDAIRNWKPRNKRDRRR
ncbi:hypothetical protein VF04_04275 [Nostoc linckia z7]|uniref:Uncharacterized protein n=2 Tax=Nostoc linckia TaxID=92942 RepID=A0A9Q5ZG57_NOSLI|nr:hypothetical protein [Nostoc linckia]PHK42929.1 hypothetical protein VF12_00975 [Nostoc linckia z15]PHK48086.1 hypothetical protein VF13_01950 [Nostoc linckia z16]PHJ65006.1 hypothetical protein VF02_11760 [Nostoc linckia z1]PHJ70184.1 hypothetical protein VF05_11920 [Nostoc linckia z3]PHJ75085.1 hypothetical protein VF03_12080 [Nostoc linckia z2]